MEKKTLEEVVSFCKRRSFIFQSSDIYGGFAAVYDYGHYGTLLKNNIRDAWWKSMVQERDDIYALDSAIFMHPKTWEASGHLAGFDDPQIDCKKCKQRMRADHILEEFGVEVDKAPIEFINEKIDELKKEGKIKCVNCGSTDLTEAKRFSLMVKSNIGSPVDVLSEENVVYLRPETCGGIYLEYKNMMNSIHPKLPFGIAQIGKAFRNEIVARQFIFRTREFEQMEMQYFLHPDNMKEKYDFWHDVRWNWYLEYGIPEEKMNWHKHNVMAHYATEAYDIEFNFDSLGGFKEVEGIHARGNWDLSQHSKHSGVDLSYADDQTKEKFIPHIMETSVGLNRLVLMFIDNGYTKENVSGEERLVLKIDKRLSPIKIAVFPLIKNKPEIMEQAKKIHTTLKEKWMCEFDTSGSIGKRYRRQDEIGTPYCVTVDFDSLSDNSVTIRDRDTMKQERVKIEDLESYLSEKLSL
ncbi:MAG: glycine--tRNA ligase [Patescibacteria group bacterium]|nr:glycine--tRNA ligase [Patescibacteria group bacterium]